MERVKVMIVDDEVLAIRHIKQLVDWEALGFEVIGESTFPEKALEMVRQLQPHIAFVDIRMPTMDGLAFSRKALESVRHLKIVLLTSYKEFEYAKEAVKIGVYDYWVKHELKADQLAKELLKIKNDLEREHKWELLVKHQLYRDLLFGRELPHDQIALLGGSVRSYGYVFILVQQDRPYPVLLLPLLDPVTTLDAPVPTNIEKDVLFIVETLPLQGGRWGIILAAAARLHSERQWSDQVQFISETIRRYCNEQAGTTVTLAASRPFDDMAKLAAAYRETDRMAQKSVFFGKNKLILPHEVIDCSEEPLTQPVVAVSEPLANGDSEALRTAIATAFDTVAKRKQPELFRAMCSELVERLDQYRTARNLTGLAQWIEEGKIDLSQWHHADSIRDWFISVYLETIREARSASNAGYSRKIRQTLEFMHAHYAEELTAECLAERIGLSGDRLRHLFKEETGFTVLEYITQIRIDQAKKLLMKGKYKIYEIAQKTGYKSSQYFSQVFRKATGVNPLDYSEGKGAAVDDYEN
jgi:two-component system response regulator YesN